MTKINGYTFKIGADPEFFVQRYGKLVSAYGLVPGTKAAPHRVPRGAVQVDGMALEFNIDPATNFSDFEESMTSVMASILKMVPGYEVFAEPVPPKPGYLPLAKSVADFGLEYIQSQPDEAKELGCMPDYNAYTKQPNPRPAAETPFRTASGHVHIGWTNEPVDINDESHLEACRALTKALDLYLGTVSLLWDKEDRRRELYGAAGAFRPKPYGMEYRVLSNKWINNPTLRKLVFHNTLDAIKATFENEEVGDQQFYGLTARQIIAKEPNWQDALKYLVTYGQVKKPSDYRM